MAKLETQPGKHGGTLLKGGGLARGGGRRPDELRAMMRGPLEGVIPFLMKVLNWEVCIPLEYRGKVDPVKLVKPNYAQWVKAVDYLSQYGLGPYSESQITVTSGAVDTLAMVAECAMLVDPPLTELQIKELIDLLTKRAADDVRTKRDEYQASVS